ncbi:MAG: hypothetical protein KGJ80_01860 [Chloroflexota bacterium]|nr:hypothetical protein [Chloroflexota bacterium]
MFEAYYQSLCSEHPEWGQIAIFPWDTEIFGFPVADWQVGDCRAIEMVRTGFQATLVTWADANKVELVSCAVTGNDTRWLALLPTMGFTFVDFTFECVGRRIQETPFPETRIPVRLAELSDQAEIEQIAARAFSFGRYHCDLRFPRELADRRYRQWLCNTFSTLGSQARIYVIGEPGKVKGFVHLNVTGMDVYVTIAAVDRDVQGTGAGADLLFGMLQTVKAEGIKTVTTKVSAANLAIVNLIPHFGGRFTNPRAVYHWHAPNAPHLVPWESIHA